MLKLRRWNKISEEYKISQLSMAYRWMMYHSFLTPEKGDGMVIRASGAWQVNEIMEGLKEGPLPEEVLRAVNELWPAVENLCILDYYYRESFVRPEDERPLGEYI